MNIVRQGDDSTNGMEKFTFNLTSGFKYANTTQARFGLAQVSVGVPGPGALALLGLAGAFGRRRR
jgi:MYXO-CTERM domain-containing protein